MLSDAALPLMILVLGMQIERATMPERPVVVAAAVVVSLVLMPLAAIGWAHVVGLHGAAFQAGVLQSSMPTAVMTTILALEFDAHAAVRDERGVYRYAAEPADGDAADRIPATWWVMNAATPQPAITAAERNRACRWQAHRRARRSSSASTN